MSKMDFHKSALEEETTNLDDVSWRGAKIDGIINKTGAKLPGRSELRAKDPEGKNQGFLQKLFGGLFKGKSSEKVTPSVSEEVYKGEPYATPSEQQKPEPGDKPFTAKVEQQRPGGTELGR